MSTPSRRARRISLGAALAGALGVSLVVAPGVHVASAASSLVCNTAANVVGVTQSGSLFMYPHEEPENGNFVWSPKQENVGSGWHTGRTLAGPDGVMYHLIAATGQLRRLRWDYTKREWAIQPGGGQWRDVGNGWARYSETAHRNKVTIDEKGRLYEINPDGNLKMFVWQGGDDGGWTGETGGGKVLDTGWNQYDLIAASGDGVLYARKPDGNLFRFRYDAAADRFIQYGKHVGVGWQMFNRVFSPGGDTLYGTWPGQNGQGQMLWYRYLEDTNTWAPADPNTGLGKVVGTGWFGELDVVADTNSCRLINPPTVQRPAVPAKFTTPVTVLEGQGKLANYFFVHNNGTLIHGRQRDASDIEVVDHVPLPGHDKYTGTPAAGLHSDNRFEVQAHSYEDAETRGKTQTTVSGPFPTDSLTKHRGHLAGDSVLVKGSDGLLSSFGVGADGKLLHRKQIAANGVFPAWRELGGEGLTPDITVVRNGDSFDVVARHTDNSYRAARITNGVLGTWKHLGGTGGAGKAAVVVHQDSTLQVLVRMGDKIYTQKQSSAGFPGTWTVIDGLTAASAPAAVMTTHGTIEVAVQGPANKVYLTGQNQPGTTFRAWKQLERFHEIYSDISMTMWSDEAWMAAFRDAMGELYVFRGVYGGTSPASLSATTEAAPIYQGGKAKR